MQLGQRAEQRRAFTTVDVAELLVIAGLSPDDAGNWVPEPLVAGLISYLLGVELPGPGTNYLKQELEFLAPAPIGQPLVASVEVTRLRPEKALVDLRTDCRTEAGELICTGRSLVLVRDVSGARASSD